MLTGVTKGFRIRAALVLAAFYALCSVTPAVALAFADSARAVRCLTEGHQDAANAVSAIHDHAAGQFHTHLGNDGTDDDDDGDGGRVPKHCCGLFSVTALPASGYATAAGDIHAALVQPAVQDRLDGRGPDRINRPPISSLSL